MIIITNHVMVEQLGMLVQMILKMFGQLKILAFGQVVHIGVL